MGCAPVTSTHWMGLKNTLGMLFPMLLHLNNFMVPKNGAQNPAGRGSTDGSAHVMALRTWWPVLMAPVLEPNDRLQNQFLSKR